MRQILHAHRDGRVTALDHPKAVVVDYDAEMIRIGLDRWPVSRPSVWKFLTLMLRSADLMQHYAAISEAVGSPSMRRSSLVHLVNAAEGIIQELGMTLETVDGEGYRLHTDPRSTLECCKMIAPGEPLPARVRSIRCGRGDRLTTHVSSPRPSTRAS